MQCIDCQADGARIAPGTGELRCYPCAQASLEYFLRHAHDDGIDPTPERCRAELSACYTGAPADLVHALLVFKGATALLAQVWDDHNEAHAQILEHSYGLPYGFAEIASTVAGWEIP